VLAGLTPAFLLVTGLVLCVRRWMRGWARSRTMSVSCDEVRIRVRG
jgi:hypothetical protein